MNLIATNSQKSGHWYDRDGNPFHDATLREARKLGLFPSVTTIIDNTRPKQFLNDWKVEQAILSALTLPRIDGESDKEFAHRIVEDSRKQAENAAAFGRKIHDFCEGYIKGLPPSLVHGFEPVTYKLQEWIDDTIEKDISHAEHMFTDTENGYSGCIDLIGSDKNGKMIIVDWKGQEWIAKGKKKPDLYPSYIEQLAAYTCGYPLEYRLINVIFSRDPANPEIFVYEWEDQEKLDAWEIFRHSLAIWRLDKKYDPRKVEI